MSVGAIRFIIVMGFQLPSHLTKRTNETTGIEGWHGPRRELAPGQLPRGAARAAGWNSS